MRPFTDLLDDWFELIAQDAEALHGTAEVLHVRHIIKTGTSADRQRRVFKQTLDSGGDQDAAFGAVIDSLIAKFHEDL